jgi:hypothetical protein
MKDRPGQPPQSAKPHNPDQLDPSSNAGGAAGLRRPDERMEEEREAGQECAGETPQSTSPCAPDGRSADRYAG